jgi:2-haloalkanoic acid dehalogenase type II
VVDFDKFKVATFDCYGTLIDWETGISRLVRPWIDAINPSIPTDLMITSFALHQAKHQQTRPTLLYPEVLARTWKDIERTFGWPENAGHAAAFVASVPDWPAFPDTVGSLKYLSRFYKLVILSNVDNESFSHSNRRLGVTFDAIFTAEDIGSYKPSLRNFDYMLARLEGLGVAKASILHTAESLFHDHKPANQAGLASCWIWRRHADQGFGATMPPGDRPRIDFRFTSMGEMAEAHRKDRAAQ